MLSNLSQFSPQGLTSQFPGFQAAGWPQLTSGPFGQPGPFNGNPAFGSNAAVGGGAQFGHDPAQAGLSAYQNPFGAQAHSFAPNSFAQIPFAQSPLAQFPLSQNPFAALVANPHLHSQLLVQPLVQLAQQIALQGSVNQQIGLALHQLAHQLALQGLQTQQGLGLGGGQPFGGRSPTLQ